MRIEITDVLDVEAGKVWFACAAGEAWGIWKGEGAPSVGSHDVEFEIDEESPRWVHSPPGQGEIVANVSGDAGWISVSGIVERVDDDSMVTLRIQTDLVMIEMADAGGDLAEGETITFKLKSLDLYPYQL